MRKQQSLRRALTIAELIVALGIFTTVALVAVGLFPLSRLMDRRADYLAYAYDLATQQIDSLRCGPFGNLASGSSASTAQHDGVVYTVTTTLSPTNTQSPTTLMNCTVTVGWQVNAPETLVLNTVMTKVGP